jgi:formiminoglutamase
VVGYFDFTAWKSNSKNKPVEVLRETVAKIDKLVAEVIQKIVAAGKIPIIIGGGHNNAYGNIKGATLGLLDSGRSKTASINVINLDAHTDFRILEGRHSGNGFSYAFSEGYLGRYAVLGAQENYIPQTVVEEMARNKNLKVVSYEDLFVRNANGWEEAMNKLLTFTKNNYTGIEVDLDAIENVLSSARSPSGVTVARARQFVHRAAMESRVAYLHICEGAAILDTGGSSDTTGKLIAYLVSDFIKAVN